jgi:hypothetical protein
VSEKPRLADLLQVGKRRRRRKAVVQREKAKNGGKRNFTAMDSGTIVDRLRAKMFARAYIQLGFDAPGALLATKGASQQFTPAGARNISYRYLQSKTVQEELGKQLRAIDVAAQTDHEYLFRAMRSIVDSSLFDYGLKIQKGKGDFSELSSDNLTPDQKANLREITFHEDGTIKSIKLASRDRALDMLNRAKNLYGERNEGAQVIAERLRERMATAAKRVPALIDGATGETI